MMMMMTMMIKQIKIYMLIPIITIDITINDPIYVFICLRLHVKS